MPRRYDAVIFDLDGTLVDTETLCNAEALEALRVQGIEIDPGFFESLAGVHDARRIELIEDRQARGVLVTGEERNWLRRYHETEAMLRGWLDGKGA